jgi:hydroxypyruvate isomerase
MQHLWSRRAVLQTAGAGVAGALTASSSLAKDRKAEDHKVKGNIKQSICRWCYSGIPLEKLAAEAVKIGYKSIELLLPEEY